MTTDQIEFEHGAVRESAEADTVIALRQLMGEIEQFLSGFCNQIQRATAQSAVTTRPDAELQKQAEELQTLKQLWDAKRDAEEKRIAERAEELTQAWLELEAEQRRFLQIRDSHAGTPTRSEPEVGTQISHPAEATPISRSEESSVPRQQPRESARQQFDRLRREIASSRSKKGRG